MKKIILLQTAVFLLMLTLTAFSAFEDIDSNTLSWAGDAIDELENKGIINGYEDGSFRPHGSVTRAEFAKMLSLAFESESGSDASYTDVLGHWAETYINKTSSVTYTAGNEYLADSEASRAEIAYALALVSKREADTLEGVEDGIDINIRKSTFAQDVLGRFEDDETVKDEMRYYVAVAVDSGIILGYEDNSIRANKPVTRAEAAVLISRVLKLNQTEDSDLPDKNSDEINSEKEPENITGDKTEPVRDEKGPGEDIYDKLLEKGHIYTLYPQKHLLLVSSVGKISGDDGEEACRLKYYIADTGDEYESVVDGETAVAGVKNSIDEINSGDVLFVDTAFWGEIGCLFVLASPEHNGSFAAVCPETEDWCVYPGKAEYEIFAGKLKEIKNGSKAFTLTVQGSSKTEELTVSRSVGVDIFDVNGRRKSWEYDDLSALLENEDAYVFVRYSDGKVSEVIAYLQ